MSLIKEFLQESYVDEEDGNIKAPTRFWMPRLHFVWDIILDQFIPGHDGANQPQGSFQEFYRIIVDGNAFL